MPSVVPIVPNPTAKVYYTIDKGNPWPDGALRLTGNASTDKPAGVANVDFVEESAASRRNPDLCKVQLLPDGTPVFVSLSEAEVRAAKVQRFLLRLPAGSVREAGTRLALIGDASNVTEGNHLQVTKDLFTLIEWQNNLRF